MIITHVCWRVPHTEHYMAQVRLELPAHVILISKPHISLELAEAWCEMVQSTFNRDIETKVLDKKEEPS